MQHFEALDLIDLIEEKDSEGMNRIMAVSETAIQPDDTFYIGKHPEMKLPKEALAHKYKADFVIDIVEVSSLNFRIKASRVD